MIKYEKKPKVCHFCGGDVIFTSNKDVYGKEYGNGKCYLCEKCNSYTGVHTGTNIAVGILANKEMRNLKIQCHNIFDKLWNNSKERNGLYKKLADEMNIERKHCHFGHFGIEELKKALKILRSWE